MHQYSKAFKGIKKAYNTMCYFLIPYIIVFSLGFTLFVANIFYLMNSSSYTKGIKKTIFYKSKTEIYDKESITLSTKQITIQSK